MMSEEIRLHWPCEGSSAVCPLHQPWMLNMGSSAADVYTPVWWQDLDRPLDEPWRSIEAQWAPAIQFGAAGWRGMV